MANPESQASAPLSPKGLAVRMAAAAAAVFAAGFIITAVWAHTSGYPGLPHQGEVITRDTGEPYFNAYYPKFRRYVITDDLAAPGEESLFTRVGYLGTGAFFYSVVNAPHWSFELTIENLRGMVLVPFLCLLFGCYFFFHTLVPQSMQTKDNAIGVCVGIGIIHALLVAAMLLTGLLVSSDFGAFYERPNFYGGQFAGVVLPGVAIILLAGLLYGAVAGGLLSVQLALRETMNKLDSIHQAQKAPKGK